MERGKALCSFSLRGFEKSAQWFVFSCLSCFDHFACGWGYPQFCGQLTLTLIQGPSGKLCSSTSYTNKLPKMDDMLQKKGNTQQKQFCWISCAGLLEMQQWGTISGNQKEVNCQCAYFEKLERIILFFGIVTQWVACKKNMGPLSHK